MRNENALSKHGSSEMLSLSEQAAWDRPYKVKIPHLSLNVTRRGAVNDKYWNTEACPKHIVRPILDY